MQVLFTCTTYIQYVCYYATSILFSIYPFQVAVSARPVMAGTSSSCRSSPAGRGSSRPSWGTPSRNNSGRCNRYFKVFKLRSVARSMKIGGVHKLRDYLYLYMLVRCVVGRAPMYVLEVSILRIQWMKDRSLWDYSPHAGPCPYLRTDYSHR